MTVNGEHRYRIADAVASSEVDGEVTILDPRSGVYFGLEAVGADVWRMLADPCSVADLCARLMEMYEVGAEECAADVRGLVDELVEKGLIEVVPAA